MNAWKHGSSRDAARAIRVEWSVECDRCILSIEDEGEGFDTQILEDPSIEDNLLKDSGRGIFILEKITKNIAWENGGRKVVITLNKL